MVKRKKKRTGLMLVWMFFTALLLTMTSYAWFSTNRLLTIQAFNIHVASKGGIEISTDAINWKGVLTLQDLIDARNTYPNSINQIPDMLEPVSTGLEIENGLLKMYSGEATGDGINPEYFLVSERRVEQEGFGSNTNGVFVAFDVFFRNLSEKTVYLTPMSGISHFDRNVGIENAFRIAFLNQGTLGTDANPASVQALRNANRAILWEPNYDTHTPYGVAHALNTYNINTTETGGSLLEYHGVKSPITASDDVRLSRSNATYFPNLFNKINVDIATRKNFNTFEKVMDLAPGITKVRIYIWVEGQDVDCEDNASIADITIDLQMTTDPA